MIIMKNPWFKQFGWFYVPVAWPGVLLALLALAFCVQVFVAIDRHTHSASDTLYGIFPYFCCCFLLLNWAAANTCESRRRENED
jgi:hypothetical protein